MLIRNPETRRPFALMASSHARDDPFNPGKSSFYRKRLVSFLSFFSSIPFYPSLLLVSSFYLFFSPESSPEGFTDETQ
jgi:hypothetical protein